MCRKVVFPCFDPICIKKDTYFTFFKLLPVLGGVHTFAHVVSLEEVFVV